MFAGAQYYRGRRHDSDDDDDDDSAGFDTVAAAAVESARYAFDLFPAARIFDDVHR